MDEQVNSSQMTAQDAAGSSMGAVQQNAGSSEENLNAFQKFLNGIFGGDKEAEGEKKGGAGTGDGEADKKAGEGSAAFTQADVDAAVEAARQKWQEEAAEAERIRKLSPEERAKEEQRKKDDRIERLEKRLQEKELQEKAVKALEKDGFPAGLAQALDYSSEEAMEKSYANLLTVFKNSLESAVQTRLRGKTPEGLGSASTQNLLKDQIAKNIRGI